MTAAFVNLMDLAPTFMELGGVKLPEGICGKSLIPLLKSVPWETALRWLMASKPPVPTVITLERERLPPSLSCRAPPVMEVGPV